MSFSVDLWNGFDAIKTQIFSVQKKLRNIHKAITTYLTIETTYNKSLENLYKEFKDIGNYDYMIDNSYTHIIDIFEYENQNRKSFSCFVNTLVIEPLNEYLRQPNIALNKCFSDNIYNEESFKRSLNMLKEKQTNFWKECKELAVVLALNELEEINNINDSKNTKIRASRIKEKLNKLNLSKQEYIDCIAESNKEREKYNQKTEKILNNLEEIYTTMSEKLKNALTNFALQRKEFLQKIFNKEKNEYENLHEKIDIKQDLFCFISNNATKEFPMVKFEFCPLKYPVLNQNVKSKCSKIPETSFPKIYKAIKTYFEENKIFKQEMTIKILRRNTDFFGLFTKKPTKDFLNVNNNIQNDDDKEFIEQYITELFTNKTSKEKEKDNSNNIIKKDEIKKENKNIKEENNQQKTKEDNNNNISKDNNEIKTKSENNNSNQENKEDTTDKNSKEENKNTTPETKDKSVPSSSNKNEIKDITIKPNNNTQKDSIQNQENQEVEQEKNIQIYFFSDNPDYLTNAEILIKKLSYLRSKGYFNIQSKAYDVILSLFFIIINQESKNYYLMKNILILSQTFYKIEDNKKVYLQEGMRENKVFKDPEIWHRVINYSMNFSCSSMDLSQTKEDKIAKINKEAKVIVVAYLCDIKQYTNDENVFNQVKNYYVKVYKMDEESVNKEVEKYMNSCKNNEIKVKEKHIKIEEKLKNDDDIDNDNKDNNINLDIDDNYNKLRSFSTRSNIKSINKISKYDKEIHNQNIESESVTQSIKEESENKENENEIVNEKEKQKENEIIPKEKTNNIEIISNNQNIENSDNKKQIINNNINIIKIEAKEVIIVDNSKNSNIDIEQIKTLKKDNENIIKDDNINKDDKTENNKEIENKEMKQKEQ